jgi:large subunit ribosomal protein L22
MRFKASHRYARISPKKAMPVAALIRGKDVGQALQILRRVPRRASYYLDKVLRSAIANADESLQANMEGLYVAEALIDQGPMHKRWLPRARGMATPILKRTSHITIVVSDE